MDPPRTASCIEPTKLSSVPRLAFNDRFAHPRSSSTDMKPDHHGADTGEDVYPIHTLDDSKINRCFVTWMMRFNDVLDGKELNRALSRLLEIGDWKKLGGRLRYKDNGKLEVYMPTSSATEYRNVAFTEDSFGVRIEDHPLGSHLPKKTDGSSIQPMSDECRPLVARPDFPSFDEMVQQGLPQISLHVVCFRDATLVSIAWPHLMMDVMGGQALLAGWSSVLAGHDDNVPKVLGAREDILRHPEITGDNGLFEELKLDQHSMSTIGLVMFFLRFLWDKLWDGPRLRKIIFMPKHALAALRAQAQRELAAVSRDETFISESDVITAWVARAIASSTPKSRPVTVLNLMNARFRIPVLLQSSGAFIQNMVLGTFSFLSPRISNRPLGPIARDNRRSITEQGSEKQCLGLLRSIFFSMDAGQKAKTIYGPTNAVPVVINNVIKADLMKTVDFSAAVVTQGEAAETRANSVGTMVTYWNERLHNEYDGYNIFVFLGKDHEQNCWMMGTLLPQTWAKLEEELGSFPA
ncbi:hypothetical protein N7492_010325 [Penicillium capsulatum]|uniref:Uncharacterized protein n=1 Tax=Penicillium capsulatum TaxID=69766 RepID=A0A9W9LFB8_9EURO|nr:hypothetical protein N7492_010325 [Penicillium capsulatum]KAJ6112830.1 hypothetical protein N7512_008154 [Penicillium capsulatum]